MTHRHESIWLDCAHPGCSNGMTVIASHLSNICASGGWYCPTHDNEGDTNG